MLLSARTGHRPVDLRHQPDRVRGRSPRRPSTLWPRRNRPTCRPRRLDARRTTCETHHPRIVLALAHAHADAGAQPFRAGRRFRSRHPTPAPTRWVLHAAAWAAHRPWLLAVAAAAAGRSGSPAATCSDGWRHRRHADRRPPGHDRPAAAGRPAQRRRAVGEPRRHPHPVPPPPAALRQPARGVAVHLDRPAAADLACGCPAPSRPARSRPPSAAAWPGAACTTDRRRRPDPRSTRTPATGGHLLPVAAEWLPLRTDHDTDPLRALMSAGAQLQRRRVRLRAGPRPARARRAGPPAPAGPPAGCATARPPSRPSTRPPRCCGCSRRFLPGPSRRGRSGGVPPAARRDPGVERDVRAILDKTAHPLWETGIRYAVATTRPNRTRDEAAALTAGCGASRTRSRRRFAVHAGRNRLAHRARMAAARSRCWPPAGSAAGSSPPPRNWPPSPRCRRTWPCRAWTGRGPSRCPPRSRSRPAGAGRDGARRRRGRRPRGRPVRARRPVPRAHGRLHRLREDHPAGQHGRRRDHQAGRGTVVVDPHGDLVLDILDRLPASVGGPGGAVRPRPAQPAHAEPPGGRRPRPGRRQPRVHLRQHLRQGVGAADGRRDAGVLPHPAAPRQRHPATHPAAC